MDGKSDQRRYNFGLLCAALLMLKPIPAFAWGSEGHAIIADIAWHYLSPQLRQEVTQLLDADQDQLTAPDLASRASWADAWRQSHRKTAKWHYVDLELDHPDLDAVCYGRRPMLRPASEGPADSCVVDKLNEFAAELGDPSTPLPEKIIAFKFVLHLAGDLHQPLHAADHHDRGGNCVHVRLDHRTTNLHAFWDVDVIEALGRNHQDVANQLIAEIAPRDKAAWEHGDPDLWAQESFEVARASAYQIATPSGCGQDQAIELPRSYLEQAQAVAALELKRAGVRLAKILSLCLRK